LKKVKSALEIALEKTKDQAPAEDADREDKGERSKYIKAAVSLARSFLQEEINKEKVKENISRYPSEVQKESLDSFVQEIINNMNLSSTPRVLDATTYLYGDEKTKKLCNEAQKLYEQFWEQKEERKAKLQETIEESMRNEFAHKGIKGKAIKGFNIKRTKKWQEFSAQIEEEFKHLMENFRKELLKQ